MRISNYFLPFFLMMINPASSLAADWSGMTPESVCSKLPWNEAKKIVLVGAGMNVSDVNEVAGPPLLIQKAKQTSGTTIKRTKIKLQKDQKCKEILEQDKLNQKI